VSGVRPQPDGSYIIEGDVTIRDLNREFDWNLPDENAATIAGLLLHEVRAIPEVGQKFLFHDFRFEVLRRHRNRITSVRVSPPPGERRRLA
jgi:Mg2+/Co2+ transporter CorB